jgi:hypothetical protein
MPITLSGYSKLLRVSSENIFCAQVLNTVQDTQEHLIRVVVLLWKEGKHFKEHAS